MRCVYPVQYTLKKLSSIFLDRQKQFWIRFTFFAVITKNSKNISLTFLIEFMKVLEIVIDIF